MSVLLLLAVGFPALVVMAWPFRIGRRLARPLAPWAAAPALALAVAALAGEPTEVGVRLPMLLTGIGLALDGTGRAFLFFTALLWLAAGTFAREYLASHPRRDAFLGFFVLTMTGSLGVVLAADVVSFYLLFALMTFAGYGLVVHRRDPVARRAGRVYLALALAGELVLLMGVLALAGAGQGTVRFGPELESVWAAMDHEGTTTGLGLLLLIGLGVKAGVAPLHVWLPLAHPVAPTPASAVLSGAMIKAGLLGWLRMFPLEGGLPELGAGLMALGVVTVFWGAVVGLLQDDAKTILAYSSVSQMGYAALGVGMALAVPQAAPAALVAVVLHAAHHGVAKGSLFLAVGVADQLSGGGVRSPLRRGLLVAGAVLPALALAGAPLTSGAVVKGGLKGAVAGLGTGTAPLWAPALPWLLPLGAGATTLVMARFLVRLIARAAHVRGNQAGPAAGGVGPMVSRTGFAALAVPWAVLVATSVTAPWWLPSVVEAQPGVQVPSSTSDAFAAFAPVLAAAALALLVARRPGILGRWGGLRIPAGDLLVLLEASTRALAGSDGGRRLGGRFRSGLEHLRPPGLPPLGGTAMAVLIFTLVLLLWVLAVGGSLAG